MIPGYISGNCIDGDLISSNDITEVLFAEYCSYAVRYDITDEQTNELPPSATISVP